MKILKPIDPAITKHIKLPVDLNQVNTKLLECSVNNKTHSPQFSSKKDISSSINDSTSLSLSKPGQPAVKKEIKTATTSNSSSSASKTSQSYHSDADEDSKPPSSLEYQTEDIMSEGQDEYNEHENQPTLGTLIEDIRSPNKKSSSSSSSSSTASSTNTSPQLPSFISSVSPSHLVIPSSIMGKSSLYSSTTMKPSKLDDSQETIVNANSNSNTSVKSSTGITFTLSEDEMGDTDSNASTSNQQMVETIASFSSHNGNNTSNTTGVSATISSSSSAITPNGIDSSNRVKKETETSSNKSEQKLAKSSTSSSRLLNSKNKSSEMLPFTNSSAQSPTLTTSTNNNNNTNNTNNTTTSNAKKSSFLKHTSDITSNAKLPQATKYGMFIWNIPLRIDSIISLAL
jgi:hypothetical protein